MDFKDIVNQLAERVNKLKDSITTEEATKNSFIMPFIQALGYDVFDPHEIVPEFTCDIGTKKGEKIDYAIMKGGKSVILIECKHWKENLNLHDNQLIRYFTVSKSRFGILTNGIQYKFYTDLVNPNIMDEKPFLDFNITDIKDNQIEELKKFHKSYFDVDKILNSASELKYLNEIKVLLANEFQNPTEPFVKHFAKQVFPSILTAKVVEQFNGFVKRAFTGYVNDMITDRLKTALKTEQEEDAKENKIEPKIEESEESKIITTEEEIEAYMIVKSILRKNVDVKRLIERDGQTYFAVLLDDNNRKPVCRFYFGTKKKIIMIFNEQQEKFEIKDLDEIYNYSDQLNMALDKMLKLK